MSGIALTGESHGRLQAAVRHRENTPLNELGRKGSRRRNNTGSSSLRLGKTPAGDTVIKKSFFTAEIYGGPNKGSESMVDTLENVYNRFGDVAAGKWIIIAMLDNGPEVILREC